MSLKDFQTAWAQTVLGYKVETQSLSADENAALMSLAPHKLGSLQRATQHGRQSIFEAVTPKSILTLIPEAISDLAKRFVSEYPEAMLYPMHENLPAWLAYIVYALDKDIPHLKDIVFYENAKAQSQYFGFPQLSSGPKLSPAAQLFLAGPHFLDVYKNLAEATAYPDTPKHAYLYIAHPFQPQIYPLHWSIHSLLSCLDGLKSWGQAVDECILEHPELTSQKTELLNWENPLRSWKAII